MSELTQEAKEVVTLQNKENENVSYAKILAKSIEFKISQGVKPQELRIASQLANKILQSKEDIELDKDEFSYVTSCFLNAKFSEPSSIVIDLLSELESMVQEK